MDSSDTDPGDAFVSGCPGRMVLDHLTSRWGLLILVALRRRPMRFHELRATIGGISDKMLSQTLRTLLCDGLLERSVEPTTPPRVSYALSDLGAGAAGPLAQILAWIYDHHAEVLAAQHLRGSQERAATPRGAATS